MVVSSLVKNIKKINLIKDLYKKKNKMRNLLLFTLAINVVLNLTDLLNLKVKDMRENFLPYSTYVNVGKG